MNQDFLYIYTQLCLGEDTEGEIEFDYDLDYQINEDQANHHSVAQDEEEVLEKSLNHECPECGGNFVTKCDLRTHVGR